MGLSLPPPLRNGNEPSAPGACWEDGGKRWAGSVYTAGAYQVSQHGMGFFRTKFSKAKLRRRVTQFP